MGFMTKEHLKKFEELVQKAKDTVVKNYGSSGIGREWLSASPIDSYKNEDYRTTIHVLEGSPPKGYVIELRGLYEVKAYSCAWTHLHTWRLDI